MTPKSNSLQRLSLVSGHLSTPPPYPNNHLQWIHTENGEYTRPIDPLEDFAQDLFLEFAQPGYRNFDVFVNLRLEFDRDPTSLISVARETWKNIRFLHPLLGARFDGKGFIYRSPRDEGELQQWADETFVIMEGNSLHNPRPGCAENVTVLEHCEYPIMAYLPGEKRIVIRLPHVYTDGLGTVILANDFLKELSRLAATTTPPRRSFGTDIQNLAQGVSLAAEADSTPETYEKEQAACPDPIEEEAICLPTKENSSNTPPGASRLQKIRFTHNDTVNILKHVRSRGLKLTPFIHSALLHAARRASPSKPQTDNHTAFLLFNCRSHCRGSPAIATYDSFAYRTGMWFAQVPLKRDVHDTALGFKDEYANLLDNKVTMMSRMPPWGKKTATPLMDKMENSIMLSSFGSLDSRLEREYGTIKLREFSTVLHVVNPVVFFVLQTFADQLELRVTYNEAYHEDSQVAELLQLAREEIGQFVALE
ncbi:hypothetical protein MW887_008094 [Aspergillus wentii]|nr:hypothetical protein MW887_008094 [Aspergillus wentii]